MLNNIKQRLCFQVSIIKLFRTVLDLIAWINLLMVDNKTWLCKSKISEALITKESIIYLIILWKYNEIPFHNLQTKKIVFSIDRVIFQYLTLFDN